MTPSEKTQAVKDHSALTKSLGRKYHKSFPQFMDQDDWIGEAFVGMALALNDYKDGRGRKLSSYINLCVDRHLQKIVKSNLRKKRNCTGRLDLEYRTDDSTDETLTFELPARCHHMDEMVYQMELAYIKSHLDPEECELLDWIITGKSVAAHCREIGLSRKAEYVRFHSMKNKIEIALTE